MGRIVSGVCVDASFQKNANVVGQLWSGPRLMSRIGSGPRLVSQLGSEVRVSNSFHILCSAVVCAVVRSGFRDTPWIVQCIFTVYRNTFDALIRELIYGL